ncbi:bifunctional alpha/beta hydrolase/OsmC family protein [Erythrobacter mangrovi]|uniref:Bifunctional alpha/beta hydrolase/OsmC family protein n=1 Tax=Erythrobacter mangrovi TaxID=2739433 RepID=A0A7D3XVY1_9SPHN|nr:bifunctional alpha/beta hydrolase/OsmC family protein [Erythrobacter mangrovi]QKG71556.1 bifunctional alpha/beta hydrolase/OsmC family protein [Erythrobacter mangrovi]
MPTETLSIPTGRGHVLAGSLEMPTGLVRGAALFAHCFTCTKQSRAAIEVSRALARAGIAALRFDFTGLGASEGEFGRAGFAVDVSDLIDAANALCDRFGDGILLVGHSLGGAAVLSAAGILPKGRIAAVATIGAPADVPHVLLNIKGDLAAIERDGEGEVTIGGRPFKIGRDFLQQTRDVDLVDQVAALRLPLLICHSPTDQIVGIEHASKLYGAARHPKSFLSLVGADHLLLDDSDARFAARIIEVWAERYMPLKADWPMPEDGVVIRTGHGKFGTEVHTSTHRFVADEPLSVGGDDSGPTPYDLLNAALGTCTAMTMKMYADRKGWALEGVTVEVRHEREHESHDDHAMAMAAGERLQALYRTITIRGGTLDDEQRAKLIEIADKCPVHRTLEGELHIHTGLATG